MSLLYSQSIKKIKVQSKRYGRISTTSTCNLCFWRSSFPIETYKSSSKKKILTRKRPRKKKTLYLDPTSSMTRMNAPCPQHQVWRSSKGVYGDRATTLKRLKWKVLYLIDYLKSHLYFSRIDVFIRLRDQARLRPRRDCYIRLNWLAELDLKCVCPLNDELTLFVLFTFLISKHLWMKVSKLT